MTHIFVDNLTIIGSDNGLSPGRRQAIIWTNDVILWIRPLGTNFSEILIDSNILIQENAFECVVCETATILSRPQCIKQGNRVVLQYTPMLCFRWVSYSFYLYPLLLLHKMSRCILYIWWVAKIYFVLHLTFKITSMHPLKYGQTNHMNPLRISSFDFLLCGYLRFDDILWNGLYFAIINCHQSWCSTSYMSRCHYRLMMTSSALLAIRAGNWPVPGEVPTQRPVTRSFDVSFDLRLNKRLSKQSWGWWFETLSRSLWRQCNVNHAWNHSSRFRATFNVSLCHSRCG